MDLAVKDISEGDPLNKPRTERILNKQREFAITLRSSTAAERIAKLKRLKQAMFDHTERIYEACYNDFRKPAPEVDVTEILPVVMEANHAIRHLKRWMKPEHKRPTLLMFGTRAEVHNEPRGTCLIVSPWNYPINLSFGPLVSAIAAGNTVVLKPSEMTPHCSALMQEILEELFDEQEVATVQGAVETSKHLLEMRFDHIFFTGSPSVGQIVMRAAAENMASVTLELGGKSPVIVDKTANVKHAAGNVAWAKYANNGQTCIAPDYVFVHADVLDEFVDETRKAVDKLYGEMDKLSDNPDYCRIVNPKHYARLKGVLDDATERGATVAMGGSHKPDERFFPPTLVTGVNDEMRVLREEIFGPIMPVVSYTDADKVIKSINARPKPLALYVYSKDNDFIERMLTQTTAGGTCVNQSMLHFLHAHLPFGGVNNSGLGNSHGYYGFKAFSHERAVLRERFSLSFLFLPPYTGFTRWFIRFALKYLN